MWHWRLVVMAAEIVVLPSQEHVSSQLWGHRGPNITIFSKIKFVLWIRLNAASPVLPNPDILSIFGLFHLIWPFKNNIINIYIIIYIYIYIYIYIHYINIWQHCIAGTLIDTYQKIPGTDYYWQDTTFGKVNRNTHTQKKSWYLSEMLSTLSKALAFNFSTQICRTRIGYRMKLNKQILAMEKSMLFHLV